MERGLGRLQHPWFHFRHPQPHPNDIQARFPPQPVLLVVVVLVVVVLVVVVLVAVVLVAVVLVVVVLVVVVLVVVVLQ